MLGSSDLEVASKSRPASIPLPLTSKRYESLIASPSRSDKSSFVFLHPPRYYLVSPRDFQFSGVNMSTKAATDEYHEKASTEERQPEQISSSVADLVYDDDDEEPEFHARTWVALLAMFFLNLVQVFALQGPPAVVSVLFGKYPASEMYLTVVGCSLHTLATISTILSGRLGFRTLYLLSRLWCRPSSPLHRIPSRHENCFWLCRARFLS